MESFSTKFKTVNRLKNYIVENGLNKKKTLIAQIFLPIQKRELYHDIVELLNDTIEDIQIFGLSSDTSVINGALSDDIVINFLDFKDTKAEIEYKKSIYDTTFEDGYFYLLYAVDLEKSLLKPKLYHDMTLVASLHSDFVGFQNRVEDSGFVYLKLEKDFDLEIEAVDSITPIGRELIAEDADKNTLKKVDAFTPKELYSHYLTQKIAKDLKKASYSFAILKKVEEGYQSSLILDEFEDSVKVDCEIEKDDALRLGFANGSEFYNSYEKAITNLNTKQSDISFLISSYARKSFFEKNGFDFDSTVGSFSNSELIYHDKELKELSHSVIMININKNSSKVLKTKRFSSLKSKVENLLELDALSNIAQVSSTELEELNKSLEYRVKKEVEKNLRKDAILIHRSRLAQMGEMMSLIAHQWKQPLSAISATSSGLHIKIELDMYDKEFFLNSLTKIEEFVNHLSTTIDDFSNFFKPSKQKREFYIKDAVKKALSLASYSLSKNSINVTLDLDESLKINSYQNELIQVLLNLIKNAENILIKREIKDPQVTIKLYNHDNKNIIEVIDNAGGVDKKIMKKIFEPYFSTKATKNSTGLGLYMSRFIVKESLGGTLEVKNSENGAIFSIILV